MTTVVGGMDIDIILLVNMRKFIEEHCYCSILLSWEWRCIGPQTFLDGGEG